MIANVSPASDQFDETLNTLKCAPPYRNVASPLRTLPCANPTLTLP